MLGLGMVAASSWVPTAPASNPSSTAAVGREVAENQPAGTHVGAPVTPNNPDGTVTHRLGGADAASFTIDPASGQLRTNDRLDYEEQDRYAVTVTATDDNGATDFEVSISVSDVEEPGTLTVAPEPIRAGTIIRARLTDPDGGVDVRSAVWRWSLSDDGVNFSQVAAGIAGEVPGKDSEAAAFESAIEHAGKYLKVRVSYVDRRSPSQAIADKSAEWVSAAPIAAGESPSALAVSSVMSGLTIPWDVAFTPDGTMLVTERRGRLLSRRLDGRVQPVSADFSDVFSNIYVGLTSLAVDPDFANNRRFYTCQVHTGGTPVQVIAWTMNADYSAATRVADPLVGGIRLTGFPRHGGCRIRFGPDGYLWITTGDGDNPPAAQDLNSLSGKVLRVDAQTGQGAPDNPFAADANPVTRRIYTYGHRNPQGLAFRPGTSQAWSVEHGPSYDDEINLLVSGGNYGWDPEWRNGSYFESVPMTDLEDFPEAVEAKWRSGFPAIATSGAAFLDGEGWGVWDGRLAVALLKQQQLKLFEFSEDGALISEVLVSELDQAYGRLRSPVLGPDGALYITTSNGSGNDQVLQVHGPSTPRLGGEKAVTYAEGGTQPVTTLVAHNLGGSVSWMLEGEDASAFDISVAGVLSFRATPRAAAPGDADADNVYYVMVEADDGDESVHSAVVVTVVGPEVSITPGPGVTEGGDAVFTLSADPVPSSPLTVTVDVAQSGDFGAATGSRHVTISTGGTGSLTVSTTDDSQHEADGRITATLTAGLEYTVSPTAGSAGVAVADDEAGPVDPCITVLTGDGSVAGKWADACRSETRTGRYAHFYTFHLDSGSPVTINLESGVDTYLILWSGKNQKSGHAVRHNDDGGNGLNSRIIESLSAGHYTIEATTYSASRSGSFKLSVNGLPEPSVVDPEISIAADAAVIEGGDAVFTLTADPVPSAALSVSVAVSQTGDYTAIGSRTVTIPTSGSATLTVGTTNDSADEPDGSVTVTLSDGQGYTISASADTATVAVSDDDVPEVSIAAGGGVIEGGGAVFTLTADPAPSSALLVDVTVAQFGDFGVATGSRQVTVPTSGTATLTLSTTGDDVDEPDGSVTVTVDDGSGYTVSSTAGSAAAAVADDDDPPVVVDACVAALSSDGSIDGEWTSACASVDRVGSYARFYTFSLASQSTVTIDLESSVDTYLYLRSGKDKQSGSSLDQDDDDGSGYNSRIVESLRPGDYTIEATTYARSRTGSFKLTVAGLPAAPAVEPEVSIAAGSGVTEGGDAVFTVAASPAPSAALLVDVTVAQSGDFGVSTGPRQVTVSTSGSVTLSVPTAGDGIDEADGSVTVTVDDASGYTVSPTAASATVAVADDDDPPPVCVPQLPSDAVTVTEVTAWRDAHSHVSAHVLRWNRVLAALGVDTGETSMTVAESRSNEGQFMLSRWDRVTRTLEAHAQCNDPSPPPPPPPPPVVEPEVSIAAGAGVTEGADAVFTVTADPAPSSPLSVDVTVAQSGDFGVSTGSRQVTVSASGTATLTVATTNDSTDEADGSVTVTVDSGSGYSVSSTAGSAAVAVADDDDPPPPPPPPPTDPGFAVHDATGTEGDTLRFRVTLNTGPRARPAEVVWMAFYGGGNGNLIAVPGRDYPARALGLLSFNPGDTEKWAQIPLLEDSLQETEEQFYVRLVLVYPYATNPYTPGPPIADRQATMTITDND